MALTPARCSVAITKNQDGTYNVAVASANLRPKILRDGTVMMMLSIDQIVPLVVDFHGVKIRPRLIFKVFRKFSVQNARDLHFWIRSSKLKAKTV